MAYIDVDDNGYMFYVLPALIAKRDHLRCWSSLREHFLGSGLLENLKSLCVKSSFRAAFKLGRRVHFELRRKVLKPPIARLPAI